MKKHFSLFDFFKPLQNEDEKILIHKNATKMGKIVAGVSDV